MRGQPEDPGRLVERLKSLGMTKYEALVYVALLRVPGASASEIHGTSSVPRASVYPVLDQLCKRDLVSVSQSAPKRFAAVPPEDAVKRLLGRIERDAALAREELLAIHRKKISHGQGSGELIWNLYGAEAVRRRLEEMIAGARREIRMIALTDLLTPGVKAALAEAGTGVKTEIITPVWDGPRSRNLRVRIRQPGGLPGRTGRMRDLTSGGVCIIDRKKVLVVMGAGNADMAALFSESDGFVRFFLRYYTLIAGSSAEK